MLIFIFILTTISFGLIGTFHIKKKQKIRRRIQQFIQKDQQIVTMQTEKIRADKERKSPLSEIIKSLAKNIKTSTQKRIKLENELESAGIPLKVEEFITIRLIIFGLIFIFALMLDIPLIVSIILAVIGWMVPAFYVRKKKEARIALSGSQLPQALETMANGMKSGFSFMQAMQLVGNEMPDPIGVEFKRTIKEINLGVPMDEAFEHLLQRLPNQDLEIMITAVLIQRSTGGNLASILETIHETISERVRMKDELKALTAQGRMSALIITLLPVALGLILNIMNPNYFTPMLSHPLGWALLGGGIISGILGWIFIQKVVSIEV